MIKVRHILLLSIWLILAVYTSLHGAAAKHEDLPSENYPAMLPQTNQQSLRSSLETQRQPPPTPIPAHTPLPALTPLAKTVVDSCPVSLPNLNESPDEHFISAESGYGNPEQTMFIDLWPGGKVIFHPNGPGALSDDGSLGMKFWFYRTIPGEVVIEGRRLDEPGPTARLAVLRGPADGYGETGFHPAGLTFPSQGCWEVTASIGEARMTFVTLVVWIPFEPFWARWLPEGAIGTDTDLAGYPQEIQTVFRYPDGGELVVGTAQGAWDDSQPYPDSAQQHLTMRGQVVTCVRGDWTEQEWNSETDASVLMWSDQAFSYRISQVRLGLSCQDLFQVAFGPEQD